MKSKIEFAETIRKTEDTLIAIGVYSLPFIITSFVYLAIR